MALLAGALGGLVGCGEQPDLLAPPPLPSSPTSARSPRREAVAAGTPLVLDLAVIDAAPSLFGLRLRWGDREWDLRGPGPWTLDLTTPADAASQIEVLCVPSTAPFTPMVVPLFEWKSRRELTVLPRHPLPTSVYRESLDLLVEFLKPFDGGFVRRWPVDTLRLSEPAVSGEVDYLGTLRAAVQIWNERLQAERFRLVPSGSECEVVCEVSEETRLGYTQILQRDEQRNPLRMKVHLSPRWAVGAEKYVRRAWVHELGHVLGLWGHSRDPRHILHGRFIAVDLPDSEEVRVARWLWSLPAASHMGWYGRPSLLEPPGPGPRPKEEFAGGGGPGCRERAPLAERTAAGPAGRRGHGQTISPGRGRAIEAPNGTADRTAGCHPVPPPASGSPARGKG